MSILISHPLSRSSPTILIATAFLSRSDRSDWRFESDERRGGLVTVKVEDIWV